MLNGTLTLHDIRDTEAFIARILPRGLNPQERDDLTAWLIAEAWILSTRYRTGGVAFSTYAGTLLRQRAHDWQRQHHGRTTWRFATHTHIRVIPQHVPLDDPRAEPPPRWDPPADSAADLTRLLRTRSSNEAWRPHIRHPRMPRRAA